MANDYIRLVIDKDTDRLKDIFLSSSLRSWLSNPNRVYYDVAFLCDQISDLVFQYWSQFDDKEE